MTIARKESAKDQAFAAQPSASITCIARTLVLFTF